MYRVAKRLAVSFFGRFADADAFHHLEKDLKAGSIHLLPRTYASLTLFAAVAAWVVSLVGISLYFMFVPFLPGSAFMLTVSIPLFIAFAVFAGLYFYPSQRAKSMRRSIENDLPFAVAHMSSIASSGIPPGAMFELLTGFDEYRDVAKQASLVVRNMKTFGMSSVSAIESVANTTPSMEFRQLLTGISFNIEKGGDLPTYLKNMAEKALFDYRIKRENYLKTLSTYADIYTALLVAAPLMMLAILGILSIIGGEIVGLTIDQLIFILTFAILPFLNLAFLAFIHITYPGS